MKSGGAIQQRKDAHLLILKANSISQVLAGRIQVLHHNLRRNVELASKARHTRVSGLNTNLSGVLNNAGTQTLAMKGVALASF